MIARDASAPAWMRTAAVFAAAAALGVLASFGQAPVSAPAALIAGFAGLVALLTAVGAPRRAAWIGWAFGFGYFLPTLSWIGNAFEFGPAEVAWLRLVAIVAAPAGLALFWAAASALAVRIGGGLGDLSRATSTATLFAAAEFARGHLFTGFPWALPAFAWIDTPAAQTAAWIGPYGLSLATLLIAAWLGASAHAAIRRAFGPSLRAGALAAATLAALLTAGALRDRTPGDGPAVGVRLVQPNVSQDAKWDPELHLQHFEGLLDLTRGAAAFDVDFVIWPETAVPYLIDREEGVRRVATAAAPEGARLLLGAIRYDDPIAAPELGDVGRRPRNSLFALGDGGRIEAVYDKHRLVPFGEFLPLQGVLETLGLRQIAGGVGGFTAGPGPRRLAFDDGPSIAPLICYEAVFPRFAPRGDARPDLLVHITNDAWFGDSAGPRQHLVQARFRAIEEGLPLVRSANTGVSAAIDPFGEVLAHVSLNTRGVIDVEAPAPLPATTYARYGEFFFVLWLSAVGLYIFARFSVRSASKG